MFVNVSWMSLTMEEVWFDILAVGRFLGFQISFQLARLERICGLWREVAGSGRPIMLIDGSPPSLFQRRRSSAHCEITSAIYRNQEIRQ